MKYKPAMAAEDALPHDDDDDALVADAAVVAYGHPDALCLSWVVPEPFVGTRADVYLSLKVGRLSRARARRIIDKGDFRTPQGPLKPSTRMKAQEVHLWRIPPDREEDLQDNVGVVFEDDQLLVVDKPPDLAVHPSARYLFRTLTHWLRRRGGGTPEAHPCHRLDRETSGVLVCAKTSAAQSWVKRAFAAKGHQKVYLAIVEGVGLERQTIDVPLALQGNRGLVKIKMVPDDAGVDAVTRVVPLVVDDDVQRTLVACFPQTGRQHQIRAHLAAIGFPLVGDKLYGMGDVWFDKFTLDALDDDDWARLGHTRHALHAYQLTLSDGQRFTAPLPDDLQSLMVLPDGWEASLSTLI